MTKILLSFIAISIIVIITVILITKTSELNERDFLLLEIFTRTYTDIYKYWNYLRMFSFVHN